MFLTKYVPNTEATDSCLQLGDNQLVTTLWVVGHPLSFYLNSGTSDPGMSDLDASEAVRCESSQTESGQEQGLGDRTLGLTHKLVELTSELAELTKVRVNSCCNIWWVRV